jgi:hypothetical protein
MKAGRVLRFDEVEEELGLALKIVRFLSAVSGMPAPRAFLTSLMRSIRASMARLRSPKVRSWIVSTRFRSSSSGHLWQVWQARLMLR